MVGYAEIFIAAFMRARDVIPVLPALQCHGLREFEKIRGVAPPLRAVVHVTVASRLEHDIIFIVNPMNLISVIFI